MLPSGKCSGPSQASHATTYLLIDESWVSWPKAHIGFMDSVARDKRNTEALTRSQIQFGSFHSVGFTIVTVGIASRSCTMTLLVISHRLHKGETPD